MNNNLWEAQMDKIEQENYNRAESAFLDDVSHEQYDADLEDHSCFGIDYYGYPYTKEDAYSSYMDSEYHAQREGD